jgi:hypothetical protein
MKTLFALALLGSCVAFAKDKPQYTYQDGVLQSFRTEHTGTQCSHSSSTSGDIDAKTDDNGRTTGSGRHDDRADILRRHGARALHREVR